MPVVFWPRYPYARWLLAGAAVLVTLLLWAESRAGGRSWSAQIYLLVLPLQLFTAYAGVRYVLAGGVLSVIRGYSVQRVPLAAAEIEREGNAWRLRWPDGRQRRTLRVKLPAPFADALQQAVSAARSSAGSLPATPAEAAQAVPFGYCVERGYGARLLLWLVALFGLFGLAIWLNQPLLLLPLAVPIWLIDRWETGDLLLLAGDHLWLLRREQAPYPIPLTAVQAVDAGTQVTCIRTGDPTWPELRLNRYQSNDLLKQLKRRLRGEAAAVPAAAPAAAAGLDRRCTLCGRPLPGVPDGGTVLICGLCAGRTRLEASAAGHGLTGKEPKPM